jgi:hypothetical protein
MSALSAGNTKLTTISIGADVYDLIWNKTSDTLASLQIAKNGVVVWTYTVNLADASQDVNTLVSAMITGANSFLVDEIQPTPAPEPVPTFAETLEVLVVKLTFSLQENGVPIIQLAA